MPDKKEKKIWRNNFSIRNTHYQMITPALFDFIECQPKIFKGILHEVVLVQKGNDNIATYVPVLQLRRLISHTLELIENKPELINKIHRETVVYVKAYFKYAASLQKLNFKKLNSAELAKVYNKLMYYQMIHHGWSIATNLLQNEQKRRKRIGL